jgi:hypothetical protein
MRMVEHQIGCSVADRFGPTGTTSKEASSVA